MKPEDDTAAELRTTSVHAAAKRFRQRHSFRKFLDLLIRERGVVPLHAAPRTGNQPPRNARGYDQLAPYAKPWQGILNDKVERLPVTSKTMFSFFVSGAGEARRTNAELVHEPTLVNEVPRGKRYHFCTPSIVDKKKWATSGKQEGADEADQNPSDVQPLSAVSCRRGNEQNSAAKYWCPDCEGVWLCNQRRFFVVDGIRVQSDRTCFELWHMRKLRKLKQWSPRCGAEVAEAPTHAGSQTDQPRPPAAAEASADADNSDNDAAAGDVDDADEGDDDDADAGDAEAEGAQVLVEMDRPPSWRPSVESRLRRRARSHVVDDEISIYCKNRLQACSPRLRRMLLLVHGPSQLTMRVAPSASCPHSHQASARAHTHSHHDQARRPNLGWQASRVSGPSTRMSGGLAATAHGERRGSSGRPAGRPRAAPGQTSSASSVLRGASADTSAVACAAPCTG
jgi:hypothetical protein